MGQEDCCCLATASDLHSSRMMSQADPPVKALLQSEQRSSRTRHPSRKNSHHLYVRIQMTIAKPRSPHSCKTPKSTVLFFFGTTCICVTRSLQLRRSGVEPHTRADSHRHHRASTKTILPWPTAPHPLAPGPPP